VLRARNEVSVAKNSEQAAFSEAALRHLQRVARRRAPETTRASETRPERGVLPESHMSGSKTGETKNEFDQRTPSFWGISLP